MKTGYDGIEAPLAAMYPCDQALFNTELIALDLKLIPMCFTSGSFTPHIYGTPGHPAPGFGVDRSAHKLLAHGVGTKRTLGERASGVFQGPNARQFFAMAGYTGSSKKISQKKRFWGTNIGNNSSLSTAMRCRITIHVKKRSSFSGRRWPGVQPR